MLKLTVPTITRVGKPLQENPESKLRKILYLLMFLFMVSPVLAANDKPVVMNVKTYIYHSSDCKWAKKCTKNCIKTTKDKAKSQGARPCKVCGD